MTSIPTIEAETLIVGAGVLGSAVALHLARLGHTGVQVVDVDLDGTQSSSELNAGGVRATFNQRLNIEMSQLTIDYLAQNAEEVGYRACGYLWLQNAERMESSLRSRELQLQMGWPVEAWDLPQLRRERPFLDRGEHLVGALYAPRDGLVNPNLLKNFLRQEARNLGVGFVDRIWVDQVEYPSDWDRVQTVKLLGRQFPRRLETHSKIQILSQQATGLTEAVLPVELRAKRVINCAGPWAGHLAKILGYTSPVYPVRRQISIFDCRDVDLTPFGMFIDSSGVYFHPEATNGLAGYATRGEKPGVNFEYEGEDFFNEWIWPHLYELSSGFEKLRHLTGWGGLYEVSPDESAILGASGVGHRRGPTGRFLKPTPFLGTE
jgi:glycine/D-amino acid oxidase-like deaminating enzyme